jgi:hypothetical protein
MDRSKFYAELVRLAEIQRKLGDEINRLYAEMKQPGSSAQRSQYSGGAMVIDEAQMWGM